MGDLRIQIECERGIYNAHSHEFGPYQVHRGPGKLNVAGEHSGVCYPRFSPGSGFFPSAGRRRYIRLVALHTGYAFPREIVPYRRRSGRNCCSRQRGTKAVTGRRMPLASKKPGVFS